MTLEEQKAYVQKVGAKAYARTLRFMKVNREEIIAMMSEGLDIGFPDYGDTSWRLPYKDLNRDQMEELRDACNRQAMKMKQGWI